MTKMGRSEWNGIIEMIKKRWVPFQPLVWKAKWKEGAGSFSTRAPTTDTHMHTYKVFLTTTVLHLTLIARPQWSNLTFGLIQSENNQMGLGTLSQTFDPPLIDFSTEEAVIGVLKIVSTLQAGQFTSVERTNRGKRRELLWHSTRVRYQSAGREAQEGEWE